jgi:glycine hydroxymethyltransferase
MIDGRSPADIDGLLWGWIHENRAIHEDECINLDPAANVMNPRAEQALAAGLSSRPSLGWPGDKYETGLEAIEAIEVVAAQLAQQVFGARFAEIRVPSGAIGNLYSFMATCSPGDAIIVPPPSIAGHVTHQRTGAAGLYGVEIHYAPIDAEHYTIDVAALVELVERVRPKLVTIGGSLNLFPHPVHEVAEIAHAAGARVLYDAAHVSGLLAGRQWPNPLDLGADIISMSTYKSLGGPAGGLLLTNDEALAARLDAIAYPGLTANFDAGVAAALAISLLDWLEHGAAYASAFVANGVALATDLQALGLPVFATPLGATSSHQLAVVADEWGGGDAAARTLRRANLLASAIGLPQRQGLPLPGTSGLRLGTSEATRWGMGVAEMAEIAALVQRGLSGDPTAAADATALKRRHRTLHYMRV